MLLLCCFCWCSCFLSAIMNKQYSTVSWTLEENMRCLGHRKWTFLLIAQQAIEASASSSQFPLPQVPTGKMDRSDGCHHMLWVTSQQRNPNNSHPSFGKEILSLFCCITSIVCTLLWKKTIYLNISKVVAI